jgi:hypothetical protein
MHSFRDSRHFTSLTPYSDGGPNPSPYQSSVLTHPQSLNNSGLTETKGGLISSSISWSHSLYMS